jgi:hypothetical protein
MNVLTTTLVAIAAMLGVTVITLPYIFVLWGWEAWQTVPREVYKREGQRLFRLRPSQFWIAAGVLGCVTDIFGWLHWAMPARASTGATLVLFVVLLVSHLRWAVRVLRRGPDAEDSLRRFAGYTLWGSITGLFLLAGCLVLSLCAWRV